MINSSMFTIAGVVQNIYAQRSEKFDKTDKVQILGQIPIPDGGFRYDLVTLTIKEGLDFRQYLNQAIRLPFGFFQSGGKNILFIPRGAAIESIAADPAGGLVVPAVGV